MRPRIGISCHPRVVDAGSGPTRAHTVSDFYVRAVVQAGGAPLLLPIIEPELIPDLLHAVDGLLLTGGGDVDPAVYGRADAATVVKAVDLERDAFDLALARVAAGGAQPTLAICRGMQVLNVALGGSLVPHLPEVTDLAHDRGDQWGDRVHEVSVEPASRLAGVLGSCRLGVNSLHHQALERVGSGVRAVAWAPDGTIEAVEVEGSHHLVAVQWHPELLVDHGPQQRLFADLVERASGQEFSEMPGIGERDLRPHR